MTPTLIAMPGNEHLATQLAAYLGCEIVPVVVRHFPDGESYVRLLASVRGLDVCLVCTLDRPDDKLMPLLLMANAAREAGARSTNLVAPYLAYMRQDQSFHTGETVSARHFAQWISRHFDALVTVDPHLHRIKDLSEIYSIATRVVRAAESVAQWIHARVRQPLIIGPDEESAQWASAVAQQADAPFVVLTKTRSGDRAVQVSVPDVQRWYSHTPVLVDDIVSTARTMIETVAHLRRAGLASPVCVAVHPIFAQAAFEDLHAAGVAEVVSCDTIEHASNRITLVPAIAQAMRDLLAG